MLIGRRARSSLSAIALRKEVDFDKGKVLLSRIGDKVYATSAFCTHYGAPLAKAVLTADGRIVWYRLCRNQGIAFISLYACRTTQPMARRLVISIRRCPMIVAEASSSKACFNVCTGDIGIFSIPSPPDSSLVSSMSRGCSSTQCAAQLQSSCCGRQDLCHRRCFPHTQRK